MHIQWIPVDSTSIRLFLRIKNILQKCSLQWNFGRKSRFCCTTAVSHLKSNGFWNKKRFPLVRRQWSVSGFCAFHENALMRSHQILCIIIFNISKQLHFNKKTIYFPSLYIACDTFVYICIYLAKKMCWVRLLSLVYVLFFLFHYFGCLSHTHTLLVSIPLQLSLTLFSTRQPPISPPPQKCA